MSEKQSWYMPLLKWLRDMIPTGIALIMAVFNYMKRLVMREKIAREKVELEKEYLQNEKDINDEYSDKSDSDTILGAIKRGGELQDKAKRKR